MLISRITTHVGLVAVGYGYGCAGECHRTAEADQAPSVLSLHTGVVSCGLDANGSEELGNRFGKK